MSEKPSLTALSHLNSLQSDLTSRHKHSLHQRKKSDPTYKTRDSSRPSSSSHHHVTGSSKYDTQRQKLREIDRNSPLNFKSSNMATSRYDRPYVDVPRNSTNPSGENGGTGNSNTGVSTGRSIVKKIGNVFGRKKEKDNNQMSTITESRNHRQEQHDQRRDRRSRSVESRSKWERNDRVPPPPPPPPPIAKYKSSAETGSSSQGVKTASDHHGDKTMKQKLNSSSTDKPSYNDFLNDLRREVASDHNELWSSFQNLFHVSSPSPIASNKKKRLDAETQQLFFSIHKSLVKRSSGDNYSKACQLVNDKTLRKENWKRSSEESHLGGSLFLTPSVNSSITATTAVNTSCASSVMSRDMRQREMVRYEMEKKGKVMESTPEKVKIRKKSPTTEDGDVKSNVLETSHVSMASYRSNSCSQGLDDGNKKWQRKKMPRELSPPRVQQYVANSTPPRERQYLTKSTPPRNTPPRTSNGSIRNLTPPRFLPHNQPRSSTEAPTRAMSPHRTMNVSFFDGSSPAREVLPSVPGPARTWKKTKSSQQISVEESKNQRDNNISLTNKKQQNATAPQSKSSSSDKFAAAASIFGERVATKRPLRHVGNRFDSNNNSSKDHGSKEDERDSSTLKKWVQLRPVAANNTIRKEDRTNHTSNTSMDTKNTSEIEEVANYLHNTSCEEVQQDGEKKNISTVETKNNNCSQNEGPPSEEIEDEEICNDDTPFPPNSILSITSLSPPPTTFSLSAKRTLLIHPPYIILLRSSDNKISFSVNRNRIQSLTLSADANSAELVYDGNKRKKLDFLGGAKDCLAFAQKFYGLEATTLQEERPYDEPASERSVGKVEVRKQNVMLSEMLAAATKRGVSSGNDLTKEEQESVRQFQKMLEMKIPEGAVRHKMTMEQVPPKIVGAVFATASQTVDKEPSASSKTEDERKFSPEEQQIIDRFNRMRKMKVPDEAIRHKMTLEKVEKHIIDHVLPPDQSKASADDSKEESSTTNEVDQITQPYVKMLKICIPPDAVRHKMVKDGIAPHIIESLLPSSDGKTSKNDQGLTEEEQSIVQKYKRMLKLSIPKEAVARSMTQEGVSNKIMAAVLGKSYQRTSTSSSEDSNSSKSSKNKNELISLHWTVLSPESITQSVWSKRGTTSETPTLTTKHDVTKLEELFKKKKNSTAQIKTPSDQSKENMARLVDPTRANNIAITLKAFKDFSYSELAHLIDDLDADEKLSRQERLLFLSNLLPNDTEIKAVEAYTPADGALIAAEQFFTHLIKVKRPDQKVSVLKTMGSLKEATLELSQTFMTLTRTCRQVTKSEKLQRVLEMVLNIGNIMNEGTRTGGAVGFKFDSLLKLTQTKSADGSITVLDYIVMTFVAKNDRGILDLESEFEDCSLASRMVLADLIGDVRTMRMGINRCKTELMKMKNDQKGCGGNGEKKSKGGGMKKTGDPMASLFNSIKNFKKDSGDKENVDDNRDEGEDKVKYSPGVIRLEKFMKEASIILDNLERDRDNAIAACKDMSVYLGESGGERSASPILTILAEFSQKLRLALEKHDKSKRDEELREMANKKRRELGAAHRKTLTHKHHRRNHTLENMMDEMIGVFKPNEQSKQQGVRIEHGEEKKVETIAVEDDELRERSVDVNEDIVHEQRQRRKVRQADIDSVLERSYRRDDT